MNSSLSTPHITADEFFRAFICSITQMKSGSFPSSLDGVSSPKRRMTKLMTDHENGALVLTVRNLHRPEMQPVFEKYKLDMMILDCSNVSGNKIKYRQPLFVHALVEHENGPHPEEEFWKLLHHYTPLKVLIFYTCDPTKALEDFARTYQKVNNFHQRTDEEYLVIAARVSG